MSASSSTSASSTSTSTSASSTNVNTSPTVSATTATSSATAEQIVAAEKQAAAMCDLPHVAGAGCIKCTGVVSGILRGLPTQQIASTEYPTVPCPKNVEVDPSGKVNKCNACAGAMAQHVVRDGASEGATGPDAVRDPELLCTCPDKDQKAKKFYGTEYAGQIAPDGTRVPELAVCHYDGEQ